MLTITELNTGTNQCNKSKAQCTYQVSTALQQWLYLTPTAEKSAEGSQLASATFWGPDRLHKYISASGLWGEGDEEEY